MGDRFYTEGDVLNLEDEGEDFEFQEDKTDEGWDLLNQHAKTGDPRERMQSQEQNNNDKFFDANNYKGIYFNDGIGDGEKYHWEETGAHFRYEDAVAKLAKILEKEAKRKEIKSKQGKISPLKINKKINRVNNIAKVKIILNENKAKGNLYNEPKNSLITKSKISKLYQHSVNKQLTEKNMKSVSNKVKHVLNGQKFANSGWRPTFKPQTTRVIKNLSNSNQKSVIKSKDRLKIGRIRPLNKSNNYTRIRGGTKSLLISNPKDSIKRRGQNKAVMHYLKEKPGLKKFSKQVSISISDKIPQSIPKHKKNVASGGSYSTIQAKGVWK